MATPAITGIEAHYRALKEKGLDLGPPLAPEESAGFGGRLRRYERGNIYYHPATGVHEVFGGILKIYESVNGPGENPATRRRELGFPTSGEKRGSDGLYPLTEFEWGAILWVAGTGGVLVRGEHYKHWKWKERELAFGYPITSHLPASGGEIVYFQRGALFAGPSTAGALIEAYFKPPLIGKPMIVNPTAELRLEGCVTWVGAKDLLDQLRVERPELLLDLWRDRVVLEHVRKPEPISRAAGDRVLVPAVSRRPASTTGTSLPIDLTAQAGALAERALYNLALRRADKRLYQLSPHCVYAKTSWNAFGFAHATDLHVSRRLEGFPAKLKASHRYTAREFNNFNDRVREFIRYANHLHDLGLLDLVLATGDLVDYIFEDGDNRQGGGNFSLLIDALCGRAKPGDPEGVPSEELRVPVFMTLGNHDYRPNPYMLVMTVEAKGQHGDVNTYEPLNLTEAEATTLQGGRPIVDGDTEAKRQVIPDASALGWYKRWISREQSYTLPLGPHRMVMLDSGRDYGVATSEWDLIGYKLGLFTDEDERLFLGNNPNQIGIQDDHLNLVRKALADAATEGIVVIGVHGPLLNTYGSEYPHYFRETEHPTAAAKETLAFLWRRAPQKGPFESTESDEPGESWVPFGEIAKSHPEWSLTGTPHFKVGAVDDLLDFAVSKGKAEELLDLCVGRGEGVPRPVDLILCGHVHRNVEYRLKADSAQRFRIFSDFYSESPPNRYYPSLRYKSEKQRRSPPPRYTDPRPVHPSVKSDATLPGVAEDIEYAGYEWRRLDVPPYARPLSGASNKRTWWAEHRPLHVQTASLGPIDHHQRVLPGRAPTVPLRPEPFQGFRVMLVRNNVISAMHYVAFTELRRRKNVMRWEKEADIKLILDPL